MCAIVTLVDENKELRSVPELEAQGWEVKPEDLLYENDLCLCGVMVVAVLERAGVAWEYDAFGYNVYNNACEDKWGGYFCAKPEGHEDEHESCGGVRWWDEDVPDGDWK